MKEKGGVSQVNLIPTGDPQKPTVPEDLASALLAVPQSTESREELRKINANFNNVSSKKV